MSNIFNQRAIAIQLSNTADLVTRTWSQSHQASSLVEKPYSLAEQTDMSGMVEHDMGSPTGPEFEPPSYPERPGDKSDAGDSPGSNNFQPAVDHLLMSLANRGKGTYVCPYGTECKRGGIDREGRSAGDLREEFFFSVRRLFHLSSNNKGDCLTP